MDLPGYIAFRMYCDVNAIPIRQNSEFEKVFEDLIEFANDYTTQYAARIFYKIPGNRTSIEELLTDTKEIFEGVTKQLNTVDSILAIRTLFITAYYLMMKYRSDPRKCGHISFWFDIFTNKSKGWDKMLRHHLDLDSNRDVTVT